MNIESNCIWRKSSSFDIIWAPCYIREVRFCYPWSHKYLVVNCVRVGKTAFFDVFMRNQKEKRFLEWRSFLAKIYILQSTMVWEANQPPSTLLFHNMLCWQLTDTLLKPWYLETRMVKILIGKKFCCNTFAFTR